MIPWVTVETLSPEAMSVASVGRVPRDFAGCHRVLQRLLAKIPALYDSFTTNGIVEAVRATHDQAVPADLRLPTRTGPHRLLIRPVFGPAHDVHGVRVWFGPAGEPVPPAHTTVGVSWQLDTQLIYFPSGFGRLSGVAELEYLPRCAMSIAELFHRVPEFDRHAEVLDLLYGPARGDRLQFDVVVTSGTQRPGLWRITMRARDDERTRGAWWLIEDITGDTAPPVWPTLERVGLREAHRRAGTHLAVVQLPYANIAHWLTDPAPWIRWDYLTRPIDVFHPDDRARMIELGDELSSGESAEITVRALNYSGGYTSTTLQLYPYPGYSVRQLAIAEFVQPVDISMLKSDNVRVPHSTAC